MGGAGGAKTTSATGGAGGDNTTTATGGKGGASTTTATGGAGGGSTATATGGAGTTSSINKEECNAYKNEPSGGTVTVRFRNDSDQPIYLPSGCKNPQFDLTLLDDGEPNGIYQGDWVDPQNCEELMKVSLPSSCSMSPPITFLLEPGATRDATWNGLGLAKHVWMPWYCFGLGYPAYYCDRVVTAPKGNYRIDALGYAECDGCACDDEGVCTGKTMGAQATATPVTMSFPTETLVEVVFDAYAFGCPDP
jgi:hypothetical protein